MMPSMVGDDAIDGVVVGDDDNRGRDIVRFSTRA